VTSLRYAAFVRCLPFAVFMAFVGFDEACRLLAERGIISVAETALYGLYPVKTVLVALLLYRYRKEYTEISLTDLKNLPVTLAVCCTGILVFILWVHMDWSFGVAESPKGFNPNLFTDRKLQAGMTAFRVGGAIGVVPIMEELFWRSFLVRYTVDSDFTKVPTGFFTLPSFIITTLLFGLEHNFIFAGMAAGALYNIVLYGTRSLAQCMLAHSVTNLSLALYVLYTGKWYFW